MNSDQIESVIDSAPPTLRRKLLQRMGVGLAGAAALSAGSALVAPGQAQAQSAITDTAIFNFALNLEYLEAEYYLRAVTGSGIPAALTSGVGTQGTVTGGSLVPFQNSAIGYVGQRIASDELAHVTFIRDVLGSASIAEPTIDLVNSFNTLAVAAGLGASFNPFASETNFLLGGYIFEDVGITAYAGAANLITSPTNLAYAASILGVEGYHAGALRERLSEIGAGQATNAIAALRSGLSGVADYGTIYLTNNAKIADVDINGLAFRRTPQQVLSIVYGGGTSSGLFFPNGVNGTITVA